MKNQTKKESTICDARWIFHSIHLYYSAYKTIIVWTVRVTRDLNRSIARRWMQRTLTSTANAIFFRFLSMQLSLDQINEKHLITIKGFFIIFYFFYFFFFNFSWMLFRKLKTYKMIIERKTLKSKEENSIKNNKF